MESSSTSANYAEPKSIMQRFYGSNSKDFRCQLGRDKVGLSKVKLIT